VPESKKIAVSSDHAGFQMKAQIVEHLKKSGHEVVDLGPFNEERVDYPDFGYRLAKAISDGDAQIGVAICGSGIGISIAVNRNPACRCARVDDPYSAALARQHNDANVIALGARLMGVDMAKACIQSFIVGSFEGGRHGPRVDKLSNPPC
jgi:ribose 5-phosphate isomerase B